MRSSPASPPAISRSDFSHFPGGCTIPIGPPRIIVPPLRQVEDEICFAQTGRRVFGSASNRGRRLTPDRSRGSILQAFQLLLEVAVSNRTSHDASMSIRDRSIVPRSCPTEVLSRQSMRRPLEVAWSWCIGWQTRFPEQADDGTYLEIPRRREPGKNANIHKGIYLVRSGRSRSAGVRELDAPQGSIKSSSRRELGSSMWPGPTRSTC